MASRISGNARSSNQDSLDDAYLRLAQTTGIDRGGLSLVAAGAGGIGNPPLAGDAGLVNWIDA